MVHGHCADTVAPIVKGRSVVWVAVVQCRLCRAPLSVGRRFRRPITLLPAMVTVLDMLTLHTVGDHCDSQ